MIFNERFTYQIPITYFYIVLNYDGCVQYKSNKYIIIIIYITRY